MKSLFIKIILPPIVGAIAILGITELIDLFFNHSSNEATIPFMEAIFYEIFLPVFIVILIFLQIILALPIWNRLKNLKTFSQKSLWGISFFISCIMGVIMGFIIWNHSLGIKDLFQWMLFFMMLFFAYWVIDFYILFFVDNPRQREKSYTSL
jgi:hypothetical protein